MVAKKASAGSTPVDEEGVADRSADAADGEDTVLDMRNLPERLAKMADMALQKAFAAMPGAAQLLKNYKPKPERKKTIFNKEMQKVRLLNPEEETATLVLEPDGPDLHGHYNSAAMSLLAGEHEGVPLSLAKRLSEEHPNDFSF